MLIGAAGVFAVTSVGVARRRREVAIRIAVGSTGGRVVRMLVGAVCRQLTMALALGLGLAWVVSKTLAAGLFEGETGGLTASITVAALVLTVGVTAALVPAVSVCRTDPGAILRRSSG